jgi:hypothetical protein
MKKLIAILGMVAIGIATSAQGITILNQGEDGDTLHASYTKFSTRVNVNYNPTQSITITCAVDSISGAPAGSFIAQHSTDGVHWTTQVGDTIATYTNANWTSGAASIRVAGTSGDPLTFQVFFKTFYPWYGPYLRVITKTSSATQKSKYWIAIKSSNYNQ